ncbi:hypothetical protein BH11ARM1_BH11ARM1_02190 [soil metagenome]
MLGCLWANAHSSPLKFDYKDPKRISAVSLSIDSVLEPIVGYAKGISGTVLFDPRHPEKASGKIAVEVNSIQFSNDGYTETARGYALNEKKFPQIFISLRKVVRVKQTSKGRFEGEVLADFTCRGITELKRIPLTATYLPGRAEERTNGQHKGDLLVLRTKFKVSRKAHGISTGIPDDMVSDQIEVGVGLVGISYADGIPAEKLEVEIGQRDDPFLAQVERTADSMTVRTKDGNFTAKILSAPEGATRFRLNPNDVYGEVSGELKGGNGVIHMPTGDLKLRSRTVTEFTKWDWSPSKPKPDAPFDTEHLFPASRTPGMAVAKITDYQVTEVKLFGVNRFGAQTPVEKTTLFQAGSMGEPVLRLTALRLAAAGSLVLDRTVNSYLGARGIPSGEHGWGARVTVRDLVKGTSGLAFAKFAGFAPQESVPDLRSSLGTPGFENAPGKNESVTATSDAFLELVIEKATGKPASEVAEDLIFKPCEMKHSTYEVHPQGASSGHYSDGQPTFDPVHIYPAKLQSGLWTNADDFGRFLCEVSKLLGGRPNVFLTPEESKLLSAIDTPTCILGIRKGTDGQLFLGGDPYGFFCEFWLHPQEGRGVLVLQNRMMAWQLANDVARLHGENS